MEIWDAWILKWSLRGILLIFEWNDDHDNNERQTYSISQNHNHNNNNKASTTTESTTIWWLFSTFPWAGSHLHISVITFTIPSSNLEAHVLSIAIAEDSIVFDDVMANAVRAWWFMRVAETRNGTGHDDAHVQSRGELRGMKCTRGFSRDGKGAFAPCCSCWDTHNH